MNIIYKATAYNVKLIGRTYYDNERLWFGLSGSGVEFDFVGTRCEIKIGGDSIALSDDPANETNKARFAIYVNGERVVDEIIRGKSKFYKIIESEEETHAVITVIKLSEAAMSSMYISEINVNGVISPTPDKRAFIEFIGDSITCGYGVDDEDENHNFSTATEDVTRAYAYRTAQALDVDYSMVSYSGYGIVSGYTGDGVKNASELVPPYYENPAYTIGDFGSVKPQNLQWNFAVRQPDLILINLGTNDDSYCGEDEARRDEYCKLYVDFLKTVRKNNPKAKIVSALGIMTDRLCPYVERVVGEYSTQTGDTNIITFRFDVQKHEDGYAANWHPTAKTHGKAAEKLAAYLKTLI